MSMKRLALIPGLVLAISGVVAARGDELETAEKAIISKFKEHHAITAKVTKKIETKQDKSEIKWTGEGKYEFVQKGEKSPHRFEMAEVMEISGNVKLTLKINTLEICDGDYLYNLKE